MKFSWKNQTRPILALAPMAGYTDSAFRRLSKEIEPRQICFTEFTSTDGIVYKSKNTLSQLDFDEVERPIIMQIFGKRPANFTEAASRLEEMGADAIDINMGCPAKKVVSSDHGSALLKNPKLAAEIVEATVKGTSLPVSVKTRIGINQLDLPWFIQFCRDLESAGASLITIHGRTTKQAYTGLADWEPIYAVKNALTIPVIGNGDVRSAKDALSKLKNLDGIMVGRATMGNPWLMREIAAALYQDPKLEDTSYQAPQTFAQKLPTLLRHCELAVETKGEIRGMKEMRKHFVSALKGFTDARKYRSEVVQISTLAQAREILTQIAEIAE
jgi:tRNA-dihydrouridine synthase B